MSLPRFRSTGREIQPEPQEVTPEKLSELRGIGRNARMRAIEEIAQRKDRKENGDRSKKFREAVNQFDTIYGDLGKHQPLLEIVWDELIIRGLNAAEKGETLDWHQVLPEIGEEVRKRAGFKSAADQNREGFIEDAQRARDMTE